MMHVVIPVALGLAAAYFLLGRKGGKKQPVEGAVLVTGCDSGIGEMTAIYLAKQGFHVFAGHLMADSASQLQAQAGTTRLTPVHLDITDAASLAKAVEIVKKGCDAKGLVGMVNVAAVAFTGPVEYLPVDMFRRQIEVNLTGTYGAIQAFMPLMRESAAKPGARRGRIVVFGTGGGVPNPSVPLISGYMASKWGLDALVQSFRIELKLNKLPIDCSLINPGITKPTALAANGAALLAKARKAMGPKMEEEYGHLIDKFLAFNEKEKGTHPSVAVGRVFDLLTEANPPLRYRTGFDSKAGAVVGHLPPAAREFIIMKAMFEQ